MSKHSDDCAGRNGAQDHGKHTPGPWIDEMELPVATRQVAAFSGDGNRTLCVRIQSFNLEADARLIAAAPDMLEALKQAEQQIDYGQIDAAHRIIIAAIAKADGRS